MSTRESPGSGDDRSPTLAASWARREGSHGRVGTCLGFEGDAVSAHVAIVAGAGGVLGHATTVTLAAGGLTVVAVDPNGQEMRDFPGSVRREVADTTCPAASTRLIDRIGDQVGPPDVLVNTIRAFEEKFPGVVILGPMACPRRPAPRPSTSARSSARCSRPAGRSGAWRSRWWTSRIRQAGPTRGRGGGRVRRAQAEACLVRSTDARLPTSPGSPRRQSISPVRLLALRANPVTRRCRCSGP